MGRLSVLANQLKVRGTLDPHQQDELVGIALYYRKLAAMQIAERAFMEMKDYAGIDEEIRPLGYRLVKIMNSRIPVLEEIATPTTAIPVQGSTDNLVGAPPDARGKQW